MIKLKSYAKINLSLDLVGRRDDGYHLLKTVMQTITLCDILGIKKLSSPDIKISCNLRYIPTDGRNIVYKVAAAFFKYCNISGGVSINLMKHIPCGAGLGGGSSNGAAVLNGLCSLYGVPLTIKQKIEITEKIGADIPFFFYGGTALCEGIGERVTPLKPLPECWLVLCKPNVSLSTGSIFGSAKTAGALGHDSSQSVILGLESGGLDSIFRGARNALEPASVAVCPQISQIKSQFYNSGAVFSMMSGSGSTVYGVFNSHKRALTSYEIMRKEYKNVYIAKPCANYDNQ